METFGLYNPGQHYHCTRVKGCSRCTERVGKNRLTVSSRSLQKKGRGARGSREVVFFSQDAITKVVSLKTHPRPAADLANAPPISDSDATLSSSESFPEAAPSSSAAFSTYAVWQ